MDAKGYATIDDFRGRALGNVVDWNDLNINYVSKAVIDQDLCIECGLCYIACEDTSHQSIRQKVKGSRRIYEVITEECVGCNLCYQVCPVPDCITMVKEENGKPYSTGRNDPRNPLRDAAE